MSEYNKQLQIIKEKLEQLCEQVTSIYNIVYLIRDEQFYNVETEREYSSGEEEKSSDERKNKKYKHYDPESQLRDWV